MILENIKSPGDLKLLDEKQLGLLASEIRQKLINTVACNGGHLASNLCVVELTIALHRVFSSPEDKIIFDVGHQAYVHKLLTGRYDRFDTLRTHNGISGFTSRAESEHDPFGAGHSSTSISAALGIAAANKLSGSNAYTIAVVGDGAFTGGMIYEALNNCSEYEKLIIILNDNDMSISANVGAMSRYFSKVRTSAKYFKFKNGTKKFFQKIPLIGNSLIKGARCIKNGFKRLVLSENFFEQFGAHYYGPLDGNDEKHLEIVLNEAKNDDKCSVIHICTKKGKGYAPAEEHPDKFHGVSGFDIETGIIKNGKAESYSERFGKLITDRAGKNDRIVAITASMESGTGLTEFAKRYKDRFFDVGIAEQHATTFACGLATQGYIPVFAVYSTFMQRAYDQLLHDAAIQNLHVVFMLDRAGLVGDDGATHHGIFDVSFAGSIPNVIQFAPNDFDELEECFDRALNMKGPVIVRYPKDTEAEYEKAGRRYGDIKIFDFGEENSDAVITYGRITEEALIAAAQRAKSGKSTRVIRMTDINESAFNDVLPFIKGIDNIVFVEEGIKSGGLGEKFGYFLMENGENRNIRYSVKAIDDVFPKHGKYHELLEDLGLDADSIIKEIEKQQGN